MSYAPVNARIYFATTSSVSLSGLENTKCVLVRSWGQNFNINLQSMGDPIGSEMLDLEFCSLLAGVTT